MTFQEWLQDQHADPKSTVWRSNADDLARAYQAGREAMREECAKVCKTFDIPRSVLGAHPDYVEGKLMAVAQVANKIKELK